MSDTYLSELRSGSMVRDANGAIVEVVCDLLNGTVSVRDRGSKRARQVPRAGLTETNERPQR